MQISISWKRLGPLGLVVFPKLARRPDIPLAERYAQRLWQNLVIWAAT